MPSTERVCADKVGNVENFLRDALEGMDLDGRVKGPGRPRIPPALVLWGAMLVCVLRGFTSQMAVRRRIAELGLWHFPKYEVTDQAVYNRLQKAGTKPLEQLFHNINSLLEERTCGMAHEDLAPFAAEVVALDESTLDRVARTLPLLRKVPSGDRRLLPGKMAGAYDVRRQRWINVIFQPNPCQNEKVLAGELLCGLRPQSLIVADQGYFSFPWFDHLTDNGYYWVSRLRAKTSYKVHHAYYQSGETFDGIVWLGSHRADRAKHAVRMVTFRHGKTRFRYITNVLNPRKFTIKEISRLYARRWDVELAIKLAKQHLKLKLLWSAKSVVIQQQMWATLIISQILQALRLEIASKAGVDPFEVSIPLLVEYLPQLAAEGIDPVNFFVERGPSAGFIRPSRRTHICAPSIPLDLTVPLPPHISLVRSPRYARRRCPPLPSFAPQVN